MKFTHYKFMSPQYDSGSRPIKDLSPMLCWPFPRFSRCSLRWTKGNVDSGNEIGDKLWTCAARSIAQKRTAQKLWTKYSSFCQVLQWVLLEAEEPLLCWKDVTAAVNQLNAQNWWIICDQKAELLNTWDSQVIAYFWQDHNFWEVTARIYTD